MLPVSSGACDECQILPLSPRVLPTMRCRPFFEMPTEESDPSVRVVLGHFIFVYIHPYMTWTARPYREVLHERDARFKRLSLHRGAVRSSGAYMAAVEEARMRQNMHRSPNFAGSSSRKGLRGKSVAKVPKGEQLTDTRHVPAMLDSDDASVYAGSDRRSPVSLPGPDRGQ
jgi:hypothetical protein